MSLQKTNISKETLTGRLAVCNGEKPAQLLIVNARLVDLFNKKVTLTNLAIEEGYVAAIGDCYKEGEEVIDINGCYLTPGLIDAHLHIESTLLFPPELAGVIAARGTTTVINDPHEIANVLGIEGVKMMIEAADDLPCDFFMTVPSCVPATEMESSGGEINVNQIRELIGHPRVVGLGEMMNYPGVINADQVVLAKIAAALEAGKIVDGHAPGLRGKELQAYLSAGISTDHECVNREEAAEKIRNGMRVIIRHGSASSSLKEILPLVNDNNVEFFMFGSDDREAAELIAKGHLDDLLHTAVSMGLDPCLALKMATFNPARHYRLFDRGLLAPGYRADLVAFKDLKNFNVDMVIKDRKLVASKGRLVSPVKRGILPEHALQTVKTGKIYNANDFRIKADLAKKQVIGLIPGQLLTEKMQIDIPLDSNGEVTGITALGVNRIAVIERHRASGSYGLALVKGMNIKEGALASTVAHDSHNIIVAGADEEAMAVAVNRLTETGGGFIVVDGSNRVKAQLPLQIGGLMSVKTAGEVATEMELLLKEAALLGTDLPQPFLTLSFLALPVIPSLKITDRGLFDVDNFCIL